MIASSSHLERVSLQSLRKTRNRLVSCTCGGDDSQRRYWARKVSTRQLDPLRFADLVLEGA